MSRLNTVNSRIKRMWEFTRGNDETLDTLKNALENLYGHDIIGAPVIHKSEVNKDQLAVLNELIDSYYDSPYSTITSYRAMVNKGFGVFARGHQLSNAEVVNMNRVFKSPAWQKVREQYFGASESVVSGIQDMIKAGVSSKDVVNMLNGFINSNNPDKSLLAMIDAHL